MVLFGHPTFGPLRQKIAQVGCDDYLVTPTNAADWAFGWRIEDANGNVLRDQAGWAIPPGTPSVNILGPADVRFASSGRPTALAAISLTSADVQASSYRCVKLDLSGRAVSKEGACS